LYEAISEYNNGAVVEVARFALTIKNLKSQIFSLRRNKGNNYVRTQEEKK
jgi:hypothetical protein